MVYYKLIRDGEIFSVATTKNLRKHQSKHNILVCCTENEAQYIQIGDELYRGKWMRSMDSDLFAFESVDIKAIGRDEYDVLREALTKSKTLEVQPPVEETVVDILAEEPAEKVVGETTVECVRKVKLREMSLACSQEITKGFDIKLSDGKSHHFSMTQQDQSNLTSLHVQLLAGASTVAYHADGEESTLYSADDMGAIINAANTHKTYHLVYFNSLKNWIASLRRVSSINAVEYGLEIPKKYCSALLRDLIEKQ